MPKISIVLPTYNGSRFIKQSIDSCINQTFTDWELIIVNDCSTDNTLEIVNTYATADKRIKVITNSVNKKLPASLNIGFRAAVTGEGGEFLTWTSDDNYYAPDALQKMLDAFNSNDNPDFVYADTYIVDESDNVIQTCRQNEINTLYYGCCIGACFLYKRSLYDKLGGYNENLFCAEDYEYWMRIWVSGAKFTHLHEPLYYYRNNSASLTATKARQVQEKTFELKKMYWDKVPVGALKKCLALYKPYKRTKDKAMLTEIYQRHPILGRIIHCVK